MSLLNRLNFNFDKSKFGTDIDISDKAKNFLNTSPVKVSSWIESDLANGSISRSDYFRNPVSSFITNITSNVNSIISVCSNDPANNFTLAPQEASDLANTGNNLIEQLNLFLDHTNRISGVSPATVDEETGELYPDYGISISVGTFALMMLANTDGITDSSPILGTMTSLYISDELNSNNWSIGNSTFFLTTTLKSSITSQQIIEISQKLDTVNNMIVLRRTSDENYFKSAGELTTDFQFLSGLENSGSTERNLIKNLIGTEKLKNSLNL
jgi:hypothetical protein